ncbi:MAG TPA: FAD-dependent monooxygenase [Lacipirellulaceae bacterium]|nr:FAD-dependent monooxygenase [Lacipirellulaceae bacterium]
MPISDSEWLSSISRHVTWDAVVLGAGPAGAIAARQLAIQDRKVLLVEKSPLPRAKVCGGCLGGAALDVLEDVGLGDLPANCGGVQLQKMQLASGGRVVQINVGRRVAVSRQTFDAALVREATQAGAVLCSETVGSLKSPIESNARAIELRHRDHVTTVRARAVIVATGLAKSPPDFVTQTMQRSRIGLGAILDGASTCGEPGTLYMACDTSGYVGIAPVEEGRLDIAAAVDAAALCAALSPGKLVSGILSNGGLPVPANLDEADWRGTPPLTRQTRPLGSHRCLLVGDAAGYVEPFTGEGIGWALQSAVLACSLLTTQRDEWDVELPGQWKKLHNRAFGRHQRNCRRIVQLLRNKTVRTVVLWSLRQAPILARPVVRRLDHLS